MRAGPTGLQDFESKRSQLVGNFAVLHRLHRGPDTEEPSVCKCLKELADIAKAEFEVYLLGVVHQMLRLSLNARLKTA
jgi:hypothetical protein